MTTPHTVTSLSRDEMQVTEPDPTLVVHPIGDRQALLFRGPGVDEEIWAGGPAEFEVVTSTNRRLMFRFEPNRPIWMHNTTSTGTWRCTYFKPPTTNTPTMFARLLPGERITRVRNLNYA